MKIGYHRCIHCGTLYKYGVGDKYKFVHGSDYCPDCREAIYRVLEGIPKRFKPRWMEVTGYERVEHIRSIIQTVKGRKAVPEYDSGCLKTYPIEFVPSGMVSGDGVVYCRRKCALCKDESGNEHAFVWWEYDLKEEEFTENVWEVVMEDIVYPLQTPIGYPASDVYPTEIPKPNGDFFWVDMLEKLPEYGYPKDCGNGVYKIWDGLYGSRKFAEEVEKSIVDEVSRNKND